MTAVIETMPDQSQAVNLQKDPTALMSMIASARAVQAPQRNKYEILKEAEGLGELYAGDGFYSIPFRSKQKDGSYTTTYVEGVSSALAHAIAMEHGNMMISTVVDKETPEGWYMQGVMVNVRTGSMISRPFYHPKVTKGNEKLIDKDPERAHQIAFAVGASKATRNVIVKGLEIYCNKAFDKAKLAASKAPKVAQSKENCIVALEAIGASKRLAEIYLDKTFDLWTEQDLFILADVIKAIKTGEMTVEDMEPKQEEANGPA